MIKYAVLESYNEMEKAITLVTGSPNNDDLKDEVNYRVGTFLHWLINYYERIKDTIELNKEDKSFFSGLRYANNKLKHDINLIKIHEIKGFKLPMPFFPFCLTVKVEWSSYNNEKNTKYCNQFNNYKKFIQNKDIIPISRKALTIMDSFDTK